MQLCSTLSKGKKELTKDKKVMKGRRISVITRVKPPEQNLEFEAFGTFEETELYDEDIDDSLPELPPLK